MENSNSTQATQSDSTVVEGVVILNPPQHEVKSIKKRKHHKERSRNYIFVWNNYPDDFATQLTNIFGELCIYHYQKETGDEGTKHLQGRVSFKYQKSFDKLKLINQIHWEIESKHKDASILYCTDPHKRDPGTNVYTNDPNFKQDDLHDPLDYSSDEETEIILNNWQQKIFDLISKKPDTRSINWYYDNKGGIGKTFLCKYLLKISNKIAYITTGKASDIKYLITERNKQQLKTKTVIFDIPRCQEEYISYQAIEEVKNGLLFSGKYESKNTIIKPPHIIIFANFYPDIKKLSEDRWRITNLGVDEKLSEFKHIIEDSD